MRERVERFFSQMDNMIPATWQGLEGGKGTCKLSSDGRIMKGPTNKNAKSAKIGDKCWWDGKKIYIQPSIKKVADKKRRPKKKDSQANIESRNNETELITPPFTQFIQFGNRWRNNFSDPETGSWFLSTPSGIVPLPEVGWFSDVWPYAKREFLAGNFWVTSYPAPTDYTGFYDYVDGQYYGDNASSWTDNRFIYPYIHQYQIDPEKELNLKVFFSEGQDSVSYSSSPVEITYFNRGVRIEGFNTMTIKPANNGFCGAGSNRNDAILLNSQSPANVWFRPGHKVNIMPERKCVAENTRPCFNSVWGWAPLEFVAYADPFGGAACLPGCEVTITDAARTVQSGDPIYGGYVGFTVIEGIPKPAYSAGNPFGFGAQYGRLAATITDQSFGPNPTKEQLAGHWATYPDVALYAPQEGGGWVVQDLSGNEPPLPPIPYGYVEDQTHDAGDWWYTSSRNGIFYAYDIFHVWEWKDGETYLTAETSQAKNPKYTGTLGEGSITLCRGLTLVDGMPGGTVDEPYNPYRDPLIIARVKIDTNLKTIDYDTFEWVATPDCKGPDTDCGFWSPYFEEVLLEHAWPDDPRVLDGLDFEIYYSDYNYDETTGFLWKVSLENNPNRGPEGSPLNTDKIWSGEYWKRPDDVQVGTQAFYDWVEGTRNDEPDGEVEWPAGDDSFATNFRANNPRYGVGRYAVLMKTPKVDETRP